MKNALEDVDKFRMQKHIIPATGNRDLSTITVKQVKKTFKELRSKLVCGLNGIPIFIIKSISYITAPILTSIFN